MTYGTRSKPWGIQSYKGQSDAEKAFQRKQSRWLGAGIGLLAIAFLFSAASAICSYLAA